MPDCQSRKYLLTLNNSQEKGITHAVIIKTLEDNFKSLIYYCMSDEVGGETKTFHTHLYLLFSSATRFSTVKNQFPTAHIDRSRGTSKENRDYVFKTGNKWKGTAKSETNLPETHFEWGELPEERQGTRTDLVNLYASIKDGKSNADILEENPQHLILLNHIDRTRKTVLEEKYRKVWREVKTTYIFGETGLGKTRCIMDHYGYQNVYRVTDYKHPFDSYNQQPVLLLDEFSSNFQIQNLLPYFEGYPLELPCRYSNKQACFDKVFIISNLPISKQYEDIQSSEPAVWEAFLRRINYIYEFVDTENCMVYGKEQRDDYTKIYRVDTLLSIDNVTAASTPDIKPNTYTKMFNPTLSE